MHDLGLVIQFELPEQLDVLGIRGGENLLILLPGGALRVAAIGQPVGAPGGRAKRHFSHQASHQASHQRRGANRKFWHSCDNSRVAIRLTYYTPEAGSAEAGETIQA